MKCSCPLKSELITPFEIITNKCTECWQCEDYKDLQDARIKYGVK